MKKNLWLILSVILLASMLLASCASPAPATQAPAAATQAPAAKHLKIGISTDAGYPARKVEVLGIYEGAKKDGNEVIEQNADNDSSK